MLVFTTYNVLSEVRFLQATPSRSKSRHLEVTDTKPGFIFTVLNLLVKPHI